MIPQFVISMAALLLIVLLFLTGMNRMGKHFGQMLDIQRMTFLRALHEENHTGPDTGSVPTARPPTGPTKPPTGGRNVRRPTSLQ